LSRVEKTMNSDPPIGPAATDVMDTCTVSPLLPLA
jgi:hypothetical protein